MGVEMGFRVVYTRIVYRWRISEGFRRKEKGRSEPAEDDASDVLEGKSDVRSCTRDDGCF